MKLVKFNGYAMSKKITIKETHAIPHDGDILVVTDERADELNGNNLYGYKLATPIEDVITVQLGKGEWALGVLKEALHSTHPAAPEAERAQDDIPVPEGNPFEDTVTEEVKPKKKTTRKTKNNTEDKK